MRSSDVEARSRIGEQASRGTQTARTVRWQILLLVWGCTPGWLAQHLDRAGGVPIGFLQGCAGDVNSQEMLREA